jgi:hypothetical protein
MDLRFLFMMIVSALVLFMFGGAIAVACLSDSGAPLPGVVSYFIFAVNATLAANLGAVLGITLAGRSWSPTEWLQWIAAAFYFLMLIAVAVTWAVRFNFGEGAEVPSVLPELTKNLIGLSIAILAAALGVQAAVRARSSSNAPPGGPKPLV